MALANHMMSARTTMKLNYGRGLLDILLQGDCEMTRWTIIKRSRSNKLRIDNMAIFIISMVVARVMDLLDAISSLRLVPSITALILSGIMITLYKVYWLMLWNHEHFNSLHNILWLSGQIFVHLTTVIVVPTIKFAHWLMKSMWRSVAFIRVPMFFFAVYMAFGNQSHDNILTNHNISMWLIAMANIVVVIYVIHDKSHDTVPNNCNKSMWLIHDLYNHQLPSFCFYGSNNVVGGRPWHRVVLKSNIGAATATLTNKGVEILAAAIDSSMTGGVATSSIQSLRLLLDSGASSHVVGNRNILQGYQELANPMRGTVANGENVRIIGVGTIQTEHFTITNVYHIEGFPTNLISVSQLYRQYGMGAWFMGDRCGVMLGDRTIVGVGVLERGVYVLTNLHVPAGPVQE